LILQVQYVILTFCVIGITSCPLSELFGGDCLKNTSWHLDQGWSTGLETTYRRASIAYSRKNGTILSHTFTDRARPAPVNSSQILQAWDNLLGVGVYDLTTQLVLKGFGIKPGKLLFPSIVNWFLNGVSAVAADNQAAATRGINALQALLAIPLYWGQTGAIERLAMPSLPALPTNGSELDITGGVERNSTVYLAVVREEVFASWATLVAYMVLTSAALIPCFVALWIGSPTRKAGAVPPTTPFPMLDFLTNCVVRGSDGTVVSGGRFEFIQNEKEMKRLKLVKGMRVECGDHEQI
jgi:hypothetical protein